jgi:phosphomannomutase
MTNYNGIKIKDYNGLEIIVRDEELERFIKSLSDDEQFFIQLALEDIENEGKSALFFYKKIAEMMVNS